MLRPDPVRPSRATAGLPLALTMGDPAGIGPDIALAAWACRHDLGLPPFVIFGDPGVFAGRAAALGLTVPVQAFMSVCEAAAGFDRGLPVVAGPACEPVTPGMPSAGHARAVIAAIDAAAAAVMAGQARAVVTNPVAKSVLYRAGFRHPGHTEYLAHLAGLAHPGHTFLPVMMLVSAALKVVPVTIHIPLKDVPAALDAGTLARVIRITAAALRRDFAIRCPRIAVAGLNPHAGESGTIGTEERDIIAPVIAALAAEGLAAGGLASEGLAITGPHSADTLFHAAARATYDAAVCMYHDQALIPIKTLAFDTGVNVTLGLPFVRTSPDHGTAFDIAGTGRARAASLIEALRLAAAMADARAHA